MIDGVQSYLGTYLLPRIGAMVYDVGILQSKGLHTKVNFDYSKAELMAILF